MKSITNLPFFFFTCVLFICLPNHASALNYYWVNGSGNWSDYANHWAKIPIPAGAGDYYANVPGSADDVHFTDNAGAAYTLNVDAASTIPKCRNMDWSAVPAGTVMGGMGSRLDIYGSTMLSSSMTISFSGEVHFIAFGSMSTIASHGVRFSCPVIMEGTVGGGWMLIDAFAADNSLYHTGGSLKTNNNTMTVGNNFQGNSPAMLELGSSDFIFNGSGSAYFYYNPVDFNAGTSHVIFNGSGYLTGAYTGFGLGYTTISHFYNITFTHSAPLGFAYSSVDGTLRFLGFGRIAGHYTPYTPVLNNVIFEGDGEIFNSFDYKNLTLTAGKTYTIGVGYDPSFGTTQTILPGGSITALGAGTCSEFITIRSWKYGTPIQFINNSGTNQEVHCTILQDIHAAGTNTLTNIEGVDLGNNTGWIFQNPHGAMDLYWVGGAGDWDDACHWTTNPTGTIGDCACIPNGATNVHFTDHSGFSVGDTVVNVPVDAYCRDMDWTGVTGKPEFRIPGPGLFIYGSLTFAPLSAMTLNQSGYIHFRGTSTHTILLSGQFLDQLAIFEGNGLYNFGDAFNSKFTVVHVNGKIRTMGFPVKVLRWNGNLYYTSPPSVGNVNTELWLGDPNTGASSTFTLLDTYYPAQECDFYNEYKAGKFHAMHSHIISASSGRDFIITNDSSAIQDYWDVSFPTGGSFYKGNILDKMTFSDACVIGPYGNFHEVDISADAYILGSHHYDILTLHGGRSYRIDDDSIQTITNNGSLNVVNANCEGLAYIFAYVPTKSAKIAKSSGNLTLQNVILDRVYPDLTTGATYAALNSIGLQPQVKTDWNITSPPPRNLYWVNGSGNWSDSNHWSLASGGSGGQCPPTPFDNVYFNAGSGLGAGSAVTTSQRFSFCKDMDWTGVTGGAKLFQAPPPGSANSIEVFGNLSFSTGMVNDFAGPFYMRATGASTITSHGNHFKDNLYFWDPSGDWAMKDALLVDYDLFHWYGKFRPKVFLLQLAIIGLMKLFSPLLR